MLVTHYLPLSYFELEFVKFQLIISYFSSLTSQFVIFTLILFLLIIKFDFKVIDFIEVLFAHFSCFYSFILTKTLFPTIK